MHTRPNITCAAALALFLSVLFGASFVTGAAAQSDDRVISADGVGAAVVGSTVEDLMAQLGPDYTIGDEVRITVDFTGHVVSKDGEVQFRAVKANAPGDELSLFIVNNDEYATAEGVGPGTLIADAEAAYGDATLSWNPDNEGREFVSFDDGPGGRIAFRTPGIAGTNVGIYDDDALETTEYDPDGMIAAIWVSCIPGTDCPADSGGATDGTIDDDDSNTGDATGSDDPTPTPEPTEEPEPTATPEPEPTATPEPTPTPTPDDSAEGSDGNDSDDDDATSGSGSSGTGGELPATGFSEVLLVTVASAFFLVGGFFVLANRNYLAPAWLHSRRW